MKQVLFENRHGLRKEIAVVETLPEAYKEIHQYCQDREFNVLHTSCQKDGDMLRVEVGSSRSEIFLIKDLEVTEEKDCGIFQWAENAINTLEEYNISTKNKDGELKDFKSLVIELTERISNIEFLEVKNGEKTIGYASSRVEALKIIEEYLVKHKKMEIYMLEQQVNYINVGCFHNDVRFFYSFYLSKHKMNKLF